MMPTPPAPQKPAAANNPARPRHAQPPAVRLATVAPPVLQPLRAPRQLCLDLQPRLR
jgi:hypothetical protein